MKISHEHKKTIVVGVFGILSMAASIILSFNSAVINRNYMPLIVFTTTCIYSELKEKYKQRKDAEDNAIE